MPQFTMFYVIIDFMILNQPMQFHHAKENLEQFEYKSKLVNKDELVNGVPFLKFKDDTIKDFIKEDKIIDAYTLYILNAFTNPRMNTPNSIKHSTEINNGEVQITVDQFIVNNFVNSNDGKDRLHTDRIYGILNENGYKCSVVEAGRLIIELVLVNIIVIVILINVKKEVLNISNMLMKLNKYY